MAYLERIKECNNYKEGNKIPFYIDTRRVGQVKEEHLTYLLKSKMFILTDKGNLQLLPSLTTFETRTKALSLFAEQAVKDKLVNRFMHENYPVIETATSEPLAYADRGISVLLGLISFGQHLNAYVMSASGMKMWIGRRSKDKGYERGKLDHMVAGGLPHDIQPSENLIKECYEEAGMSEALALTAKNVGVLSYSFEYSMGGKKDYLYCYDIELDEEFVPNCTDGEVEAFYLMPIEEVALIVKNTNDFKLNCNLVIIDFLVRHGYINSDDEDYIAIVAGLRQ